MDNATLFNCCTDHAEPDWSIFDALEVGGCIDLYKDESRDETCIEGGKNRDQAEFFTVYGHLREGGCEAITDAATVEEAERIAARLSERGGGLPVHVCC